MAIQVPFPIPSTGFALNSKLRVNLDFIVGKFNEFNTGTATWDTVAVGTANNLTGTVTFWNSSNTNYLTIQAGATSSSTTLTLPTGPFPNTTINLMSFTDAGVGSWISGLAYFADASATYVTVSSATNLANERRLNAGGGITLSDNGANSTIDIVNAGVTSITGTSNQVIASGSTGGVTLSTPQSIATTSDVQFNSVYLAGLGNVTTPAVRLYSSANASGFYVDTGTDNVSLVIAGTQRARWDNTVLWMMGNLQTASLILRDAAGANPTVTLSPPTGFTSYSLTLPTDDGDADQVLTTNGSGTLSWTTPSSGSGTVNNGTAGNLAIYPSTATTVDDTYTQNGNLINVAIAAHASLAATRTYTIPEAGASANFVMSEGTATINGTKTFSSTVKLTQGATSPITNEFRTNSAAHISVVGANGGSGSGVFTGDTAYAMVLGTATNHAVQIFSNDSKSVDITGAGEITQPRQPSFLVTDGTGASNVTGDGTQYTELWPTEIFDQGGDFSSNTFTAPVTGRYELTFSIMMDNLLTSHTGRQTRINTSNRTYIYEEDATTHVAYTNKSTTMTVLADMDAGDTATASILVSGGTKTVDINASGVYNQFSGSLIN